MLSRKILENRSSEIKFNCMRVFQGQSYEFKGIDFRVIVIHAIISISATRPIGYCIAQGCRKQYLIGQTK